MRRLVQGLVVLVLTATPIPGAPDLTVPTDAVPAGTSFTAHASGYNCTDVLATFNGTPNAKLFPTQKGKSDVIVEVPADLDSGEYELEVYCDEGVDKAIRTVRVVGAPRQPSIVLSPRSARLGDLVTVTGTGFDDCVVSGSSISATPDPQPVTVTLDGATVATQPVGATSPDTGTFRATFTVQPGTVAAAHEVIATCPNRFVRGSSTATATLTVLGSPGPSPTPVPPGSGGSGGSPRQLPGGDPPAGSGSGIAPIAIVAVIAAIGLVALRRRLRPAGAAAAPLPVPRPSQGLPHVAARAAGLGSGPAQISPVPGRDVSIRVVARTGGVR
jgi:hypothetical protein